MNYSYKRYVEPTTTQVLATSIPIGAIATTITQPLDMVKTRIQQRSEGIGIRQPNLYMGYNMNRIFREIHATGVGLRGFYAGFDAAIIGRSSYLFIRNTLYKLIYDRFKPRKPTNDLSTREKAVIASVAGGVATFLTNPFDLVLTRAQVDKAYRPELRRNYTGFMNAYNRIVVEEGGLHALFKGVKANLARAVILNSTLTIPYDYLQERMWVAFGDISINRPVALAWAAFWATLFSLPFDNIKTRLQIAFPDPARNRLNYTGVIDCARSAFLHEGYHSLLVGFYPYYLKVFIYGAFTVYAYDIFTNSWKRAANLPAEKW